MEAFTVYIFFPLLLNSKPPNHITYSKITLLKRIWKAWERDREMFSPGWVLHKQCVWGPRKKLRANLLHKSFPVDYTVVPLGNFAISLSGKYYKRLSWYGQLINKYCFFALQLDHHWIKTQNKRNTLWYTKFAKVRIVKCIIFAQLILRSSFYTIRKTCTSLNAFLYLWNIRYHQ